MKKETDALHTKAQPQSSATTAARSYQTTSSSHEDFSQLEGVTSTSGASLKRVLEQQKDYFESGATRSYEFRIEQLNRLKKAIRAYESKIAKAAYQDLRKNSTETFLTEIGFLYDELRHTKNHLKKWMKPEKVGTPLLLAPAKSKIIAEPLGQVLIISPWNYPFQLLMAPVISAIAAGNTVVLKPSEVAPHMSQVIAEMIAETFDERYIATFEGGVAVSEGLLSYAWDHVFFTGSTAVGKIVAQAAAKHLTPVTLELGGKSPAIVDHSTNLTVAARRIAWGKFVNAGQTCIAPDYVLIHEQVKDRFIRELKQVLAEFFGDSPQHSTDFGRIINHRHFDRLVRLLDQGNIVIGGDQDREDQYIAPTVVTDVSLSDPVMQEEIFGPILPVMTFTKAQQIVDCVRSMPRPLALYLFTEDRNLQETIVGTLSYGGGAVNDTIMHFLNANMPFGGVGHSGLGSAHGKFGFDRFSHKKSMLYNTMKFDLPVRYAPFAGWKERVFRSLMDRN